MSARGGRYGESDPAWSNLRFLSVNIARARFSLCTKLARGTPADVENHEKQSQVDEAI